MSAALEAGRGLKTIKVVNMVAKFSTALPWEARLYLFIGFNRKQKTKRKKCNESEVRVTE